VQKLEFLSHKNKFLYDNQIMEFSKKDCGKLMLSIIGNLARTKNKEVLNDENMYNS